MKHHLRNLFLPHHGNNHKPKILHHNSLSKLVMIILFFQLLLTGVTQIKPGVLGYASNITVDQVLQLTNQQRQGQGLPALSFNATLSESAKEKAQHMFSQNYWAHNAPDGTTPWAFFQKVGYKYLYAGENLARDFGDSGTVVKAWMDSPTHRENIMSGRYTEIGIAVVNGLLNGQETTLVVQHFGKQASQQPAVADAATTAAPNIATKKAAVLKAEVQQEPVVAFQAKVEEKPVQDQVDTVLNQPDTSVQLSAPTGNSSVINSTFPMFSTFDITKSLNIALSLIVILVLALDGFLIWHRKTVRRSGKSFIHLSLFVLVTLIMILTGSGKIL